MTVPGMVAAAAPVPTGAAKPGVKIAPGLGLAGFLLALETAGFGKAEIGGTARAGAKAPVATPQLKLDCKDEPQPGETKADDLPAPAAASTQAAAGAPIAPEIVPQPLITLAPATSPGSLRPATSLGAAAESHPQAGTPAAQSTTPQAKEELAFAARISTSVDAPGVVVEKAREAAMPEHAALPVTQSMVESRAVGTRTVEPETAKPVAKETEDVKPPAVTREISVRVAGEREHVEIRMVEQNGEMRVAVRTPDMDLARGLRSGISDLVGRLEHNGYQAEVWRPGESAQPDHHHHSQSGARDGQPDRQSDGSTRDQQQRDQREQPSWVEEISKTFGAAAGRES